MVDYSTVQISNRKRNTQDRKFLVFDFVTMLVLFYLIINNC